MDKFVIYLRTTSLAVLAIFLLSSCSLMHKRDGAPNYNVDVSNIPDAVPKKEALSKYGNMPSYRVFGRRYYTLQSSKNYDQIGTASWYGTKFHSHRTSSGERYDMLSMTAAHKTLPLPSYVEVTNLRNNRKIIVKVNDRGPFESNRLIDLSYVAAKKLGMTGRGTAKVRVKAIDPDEYEKPSFFANRESKSPATSTSRYRYDYIATSQPASISSDVYLQVGAFRNKSRALALQRRLSHMVDAPVQIAKPNHRSTLYRVKVGPIKDVATAKQMTRWLHNIGIKSNQV